MTISWTNSVNSKLESNWYKKPNWRKENRS